MYGLTFIAVAYKRSDQWRETRQRNQRLERHKRLVLSSAGDLTQEERQWLGELEQQLNAGELPDSLRNCPECQKTLQLATVNNVELDCCSKCQGMWFDPGELQAFSGLQKEIPSDDKMHRPSRYHCPDCQTQMREYVFVNPHTLLVDCCPKGHGIFLTDRELERVFVIA